MTVLFLNPAGQLGGAETALLEVLSGLRRARPDWRLGLVVGTPGPLLDRAAALGVTVELVPMPARVARLGEWGQGTGKAAGWRLAGSLLPAAGSILGYAWQLRRAVTRAAADILHTNGLKMHALGAGVRPRRTLLLWHVHDYVGRRPLSAGVLRRLAGRCAAVVAASDSVATDARRALGGRVDVTTVRHGVDLVRFSPEGAAADLDRAAGLPPAPPETVRVGLVATFARWKGHDVFLQALSRVSPDVPVRGYVVGGPVYDTSGSQTTPAELRKGCDRLGLGDRVGFIGFQDDVAPVYRALDLVVHASTEPEPFGLVVAEAMACGRPVLTSRTGGVEEFTARGTVTHTPGDAAMLARQIVELASDVARRRQLGRQARAAAETWLAGPEAIERLVSVYTALTATPAPAV